MTVTVKTDNGTDTMNFVEKTPLVLLILYSMLYIVTYLIAIVGNIMAMLTCYKNYRITTSILLVYIASLAIADLLFTLLTTFDYVYFFTNSWPGGNAVCKLQGFFVETSYSASILTLVAISYERYRSVASKGLARSQRIERRTIISKGIWVFSVLISLPLLYGYSVIEENKTGRLLCVNHVSWGDRGRQIYYTCQAGFIYLLPLSFMIWAHWKIFQVLKVHAAKKMVSSVECKQRKITHMLAVVTLIFFACWSPFIGVRALRYYYVYEGFELWKLTQLVILVNSAINPVLYCFYSGQFRTAFKQMITCKWKMNLRKISRASRRSGRESHSPNSFADKSDEQASTHSTGWHKLSTLVKPKQSNAHSGEDKNKV
ncbi:D(2) dopamine receptor [Exaiptasia diaphana]|uniref:G-protein coupled receptors family 1 profile domain-containing protein n=1 Tax=Exaiptasia diaphana TaxID=2652724 RepID=A0A913XIY5_EXADI|nr:D(2) dopamine receptor [Exaiptasia diaphana]